MRIAILGWGSLIWDPRDLPLDGIWQEGGPCLPIEFSRFSSDRRLTLVIDPNNGTVTPTRFALSSLADLDATVSDLSKREKTALERIGYIDLIRRKEHSSVYLEAGNIVGHWAESKGFDAVIWTDLPPNFEEKTGLPFTPNHALKYLKGLSRDDAIRAHEYIKEAPPEVDTPFRRRLSENG